jgi:hypothetical protein
MAYYLISKRLGIWPFNSSFAGNKVATNKAKDIMTADEKYSLHLFHLAIFEVTSRDANGKPVSYKVIGMESPKPIPIEIMQPAEVATFHIASSTKIQVLLRDKNGKVLSYRIMKNDSDIMKDY